MTNHRTEEFQRNQSLESLLMEISSDLQKAEQVLADRYIGSGFPYPLILVMGPLRSGTTLFMQWLASTGVSAYPTNLLSRFYAAPIIGAKIQLLLTDPRYSFRDELGEFVRESDYKSENGKTSGALAPNEFWYFWRRFLADPSRDVWADDELGRGMDIQSMLSELSGIMSVFQKPFAAKGMLFNYNIAFLNKILANVLFVQLKRDPVANVASILEARERQHGRASTWYSFKIPEYDQLKDLDPIMQAAGQVHYINRAVNAGMSTLNEGRRMQVNYEDLCNSPRSIFVALCEKLHSVHKEYKGPKCFKVSWGGVRTKQKEIRRAIDYFA